MKKKNKKIVKIVNAILKIVVIIVLVRQLMLKEWFRAFTCLYALIMLSLPKIINKKFKIDFPNTLEITIYVFVVAAEIFGEVGQYFLKVSWWDDLLHTVSGFILAGVGIFFIDFLNKNDKQHFSLSPIYVTIASLCFSITILCFWEVIEYSTDLIFKTDMQKDTIITKVNSVTLNSNQENKPVCIEINSLEVNGKDWIEEYGGYIDIGLIDTMSDLIDGFIGASIYSVFGYFYLKNRNEKNFATMFIPKISSD